VKRRLSTLATLVLGLAIVFAGTSARADEPPPTAAQLEQAKKAFLEGRKLHDAGKLPEAIEKFKESYKLSKNPLLLYNIGLTMEEAAMEDLALFYYRKFLKDAPQDAQQRASVEERVKVLEKKFDPNAGKTDTGKPDTGKPDTGKPDTGKHEPITIKPAGTYSESDFQHQSVDSAPPGKPLDVTAFVPEDSGWVVTLHYRTAGEGKFTEKKMRWRYKELVARIPAPKMIGNAVQYFIEVKDQAGNLIARSGKSISPNQVLLEAGATPRFYPDMTDDGEAKLSPKDIVKSDDDDDPLNRNKKKNEEVHAPVEAGPPGTGFADVGSSKFKKVKLGTTIATGTLFAFAALSYVQALKYSSSLEDDSKQCGAPPCRQFDDYAAGVETTGKRWQTFFRVGLGLGIATGVVAGYYWWKEHKAKQRGELKVSKTAKDPATTSSTWIFVPTIDQRAAGAAAAVRF